MNELTQKILTIAGESTGMTTGVTTGFTLGNLSYNGIVFIKDAIVIRINDVLNMVINKSDLDLAIIIRDLPKYTTILEAVLQQRQLDYFK